VGVVAVSSAAPIIRLAAAPALTVAAWRLALAALVALPIAAVRAWGEWRTWPPRTGRLLALSGVCLGVHFALWIRSLDLTTVASSVLFVTTTPIWTGIASHLLLGERLAARQGVGILVAIAGSALVGGADLGPARHALLGDGLAIAGSWAVSAYFLVGRAVRPHVSLAAYVGVTYAVAAATLVLLAGLFGAPLLGISPRTLACVVALAAGPQLLGHSSFNWALRHLPAAVVTVVILAEPIGATLLAAAFLGERPSPLQALGGAVLLAGIALAAGGGSARAATPPPPAT
jgi:drug/metabolite transporter (DMT)-like permease